ncbi:MAG TPA: PilZ domain-containing protein [Treponemataceae bacterium]|nr:PilZ domain-containing protein [Treponemataceae bacterium]
METERRKNCRCAISQCVKLSYAHEDFIDAEMINISIGGTLCSTDSPLSHNERIFFMFDVPLEGKSQTVKVEGTIIHIQEQHGKILFGVTFTDFFPGSKELLQKYIDEYNER